MKPKSRARGQCIPKRPRIVSTAEATQQEGLQPSGYTALSKEAMMAGRSGRGPNMTKSVAAGPEPVLRPTNAGIELRYCNTSRVHELFGLVHLGCMWSMSLKEQHVLKS